MKPNNLNLSISTIQKTEISTIEADKKEHTFGYYDGNGDPIIKTTDNFIRTLIYDHYYSRADEVAENLLLEDGTNSSNTILKDIAERKFMAYHFHGFDPSAKEMDWSTLYVIFDKENGNYKLRALVKSNWSI